ncbi:MAG: hypothetical protein P857_88 [Candidatus Xenolissoclinum pacificiensis L6]|uniref:Uncharacterized protein n=1 Tax=Candidatus Xenolissoclinum pacificiensis L6 TaxID=1401685 RepID=W2V0M2_9RICK|nr:MAG: hypothetical protein P857_88 [Candidatus Xenolissoclinum pacificiensis L6]
MIMSKDSSEKNVDANDLFNSIFSGDSSKLVQQVMGTQETFAKQLADIFQESDEKLRDDIVNTLQDNHKELKEILVSQHQETVDMTNAVRKRVKVLMEEMSSVKEFLDSLLETLSNKK